MPQISLDFPTFVKLSAYNVGILQAVLAQDEKDNLMGNIVTRTRKNGSIAYMAQLRIVKDGKALIRENRTFDRKQAASAWLEKREKELNEPGGLERALGEDPTLASVIDRYIAESAKAMGKTKVQVLRTIKTFPIAQMRIKDIHSPDVLAMLRAIDAQPSTRGNYLSHLSTILTLAPPSWGYEVDPDCIRNAMLSAKRLGIIAKAKSRSRRPTLDELDKLMSFFQDRERRHRGMVPMTRIIPFAVFSTRRQEEIIRIRWDDLDQSHSRILVRDMKNPGEKLGNDIWCDLPEPAMRIIQSMSKTYPEIFPYSTDAISANFTRACKLLGIEDLTFHDLRHEGASRLFEMGLNIPQVASVTGHRSWSSLQRYTHIRTKGDKYQNWTWFSLFFGSEQKNKAGKV